MAPPTSRRIPALAIALVLAIGAITAVTAVVKRIGSALRDGVGSGDTRVTQGVVVEKMQAVARLVTSETTLRDVVVYQNRRLGSTKRSLVVVTGRVLTGFDLDRGTEVRVDHEARRIRLELPAAAVLGVEVTDMRTYDEHRGLWNPFTPDDRDTIFQLARAQLVATAGELEVREHAQESARRLLTAVVAADGYAVEVAFRDGGVAATPLETPARRDTSGSP